MANSDGTVEVRITGSVDSSLTSSTAQASATVGELGAATKLTSAQMGVLSAAMAGNTEAHLNAVAQSEALAASRMGTAEAAAAAAVSTHTLAAAEIEEAGAAVVSTAAHTNARAVTESLAAIHEIMQGRTSRLGGTLMILAQALTGASTGMLVMGAASVGAVLGIAYLEYESLKAEQNIKNLAQGFALTGRAADMSADAVRYNLSFLSQLPGSTSKAADGFIRLVSQHAEWNTALINSVGQLLPAFVHAYGEEAPQAAGKLVAALSDLTESGFEKLNRELLGLKPQEFETIQNLIAIGNTAEATSRILAHLSANSGQYIKSLGDKVYDKLQEQERLKNIIAAGDAGDPASFGQAIQQLDDLKAKLAEIRAEEGKGAQHAKDSKYEDDLVAVQRLGAELSHTTELEKQMQQAKNLGAQAASRGDKTGEAAAATAESAIQKKLNDENYRNYSDRQNAMADAAKHGSAARVAAAQNEVDEAKKLFGDQSNEYLLALGRLNSAKLASSEQGAHAAAAAEKIGAEDAISAARNASSEIVANDKLTTDQKIANAKAVWDQLKKGDLLNAAQRAQATRDEAAQETEIRKAAAREQESIAQGHLNTQLELSKIAIEGEKTNMQLGVGYQDLTAAQKIAIIKGFDDQEIQLEIDAERKKQDGYATTTKVYQEAEDKIVLLTAQRVQKDNQYAVQEQNAQIATWKSTDAAIEGAESSLVSDIFTKRQGLAADLREIGLKMLQDEITDDLRKLTQHELVNLQMLTSDEAVAQGGMIFRLGQLLFDKAQTSTTEAAKTATVATSAATQQAVMTTAQSEAVLQTGIMTRLEILDAAALAAAFAFADSAQMGPPGLIAAPAVAAAAFGEVASFASLDTGTNWLPSDQIIQAHEGERVIPKADNRALMSALNGGPGGGRGGSSSSLHVTHNISTVDAAGFDRVLSRNMGAITRMAKNYQRNHVR